jgi:pyroglutamyl-peptidase
MADHSSAQLDWILVTGFGAFPGVLDNPTEAVARTLDGRMIAGTQIRAEVLDVTFAGVAQRLETHLVGHPPAATIHLGVAVQSTHVRLERQAVNWKRASIPDVAGVSFDGVPIDAAAEPHRVLETDVPVGSIVASLQNAGFAARESDDPGRYVCNCTYYQALRIFGAQGIPSLFVHVPPLGVDPGENESGPWTSEALLAVAERVIEAVVE